jgi:hypothetical protein
MSYGLTLAHRRSSQAQQTFGTPQASGRLVSETVWRDTHALAASRNTATTGEAAAAQALNGVVGASGEYRLVFSPARPA